MNYNLFSGTNLDLIDLEINSRSKLDTGTFCNYECSFCYYLEDLDKVTSLEIIKKRARDIKALGIKQVDLSGGESSLHSNWFEILDYCVELGFEKISCLSNGSRFSSIDFIKKSQDRGLSEILFSIHGSSEAVHDKVVKRNGAFKKLMLAVENAKSIGVEVRINCTVTEENSSDLVDYVSLINRLKPLQLNFLPLNYWGDAKKIKVSRYEIMATKIKEAIVALNNDIEINVRYIPFCFMNGYEKYVVGTYQHIFDTRDWNIITYDIKETENVKTDLASYYAKAKEKRLHSYFKPRACLECKYFDICDGVEQAIGESQNLNPIMGEKIKDVMYFRRSNQ